jgi:hypothetical protein
MLRSRPVLTATKAAARPMHAEHPLDDENHEGEQGQDGQVRDQE